MRSRAGPNACGAVLGAGTADLIAGPAEQMIEMLRGLADVLFVDTSGYWGDAVAMAVGACDRCLVVGGSGAPDVASAQRAMKIAMRLGVPATRMTSVFNRLGAPGCGEDRALRFEMGVSLRSRVRIADGGDEVASMLSFGHIDRVVAGSGRLQTACGRRRPRSCENSGVTWGRCLWSDPTTSGMRARACACRGARRQVSEDEPV